MKRKNGEISNDEQPKKHPAHPLTPESTTHPRFRATEKILERIKSNIENYYTTDGLKSHVQSSIVGYFQSDDSESLKALEKLLNGIKTLLLSRPEMGPEPLQKVLEDSVRFAYTFATEHDFFQHKEFLEGENYKQCISPALIEEMGKVAHCYD